MQARIRKDNDITVIELFGYVDIETIIPFENTCFQKVSGTKVIFDFQNLNFVGSCGISNLIEFIANFREKADVDVRFSGMSSEFKKMFQASRLSDSSFFEDAQQALRSYSQVFGLKLSHISPETDWIEEDSERQKALSKSNFDIPTSIVPETFEMEVSKDIHEDPTEEK